VLLFLAQPALAALEFDPQDPALENQAHIRPSWCEKGPGFARSSITLARETMLTSPLGNAG
jgi:hypothetical protein